MSYESLYLKCPCGKSDLKSVHTRNFPLYEAMAKHFGFRNQVEIPMAFVRHHPMDRGYSIYDHIRAYSTFGNGTVLVTSPYMDERRTPGEMWAHYVNQLSDLCPTFIYTYWPRDSYYNPNTFTFVIAKPATKSRLEKIQ